MKRYQSVSFRVGSNAEIQRLIAKAMRRLRAERGERVTKGAALRAALIAYTEAKR